MTINDSKPVVVALDVGGRRIGVAVGRRDTRFASPLTTLLNDEQIWDNLRQVIVSEDAGALVVGLPRGMNGQETDQTNTVREFAAELQKQIDLPFFWQDEAVTSVEAEAQLKASGKRYTKEEIDAGAAAIILQDYLNSQESR